MFVRDDWTLFRNLATLGQKAGVHRDLLADLALKELADNALDAGAAGEISDNLDGSYTVSDDGPGIPGTDAEIAQLFSIRRPLTSSKLLRLPTRGALGNGLRVVAGTVLASGGSLTVQTRGRVLELTPNDDGSTTARRVGTAPQEGTRVTIFFGPGIKVESPEGMAATAMCMRGESWYTGKTSPYWYDSDSFFEMLQAFGAVPVGGLLAMIDGGKGRLPEGMHGKKASEFTRVDADQLLRHLRDKTKPPKHGRLGVVGEDVQSCDGYAKKTGDIDIPTALGCYRATIPAVVEVWAERLGDEDSPEVIILANRTPITARVSCGKYGSGASAKTYITGCGLNHHFKTGRAPMRITVCVTAPYLPITTDGKEPNLRPLLSPINDAIASAARKAKAATASSRGGVVTTKDLIFDVVNEAAEVASGDGAHRFSLRQLFYAVRPLLQDAGFEDELKYKYFGDVISDYEARLGHDMPGMYRDARGVVQHPHEVGQIPLGTLNVETYKRPPWRFNKVLYIEKGGFLPLLADAKWAECHDCAILTSQGMATRAVRDLLDLLGDTTEDLEFFCIHDADGPGSIIHQALVEGTKARPGRRVTVTNLGLDPWEAVDMGLQVETFTRKGSGEVSVAQYIKDYDHRSRANWTKWLQTHRVELNAMPSPQFLKWLDMKMVKHSENTKVIPPTEVLHKRYLEKARETVLEHLLDELMKKHGIEAKADRIVATMGAPNLHQTVRAALGKQPELSWEKPLDGLAAETSLAAAEKYVEPVATEKGEEAP